MSRVINEEIINTKNQALAQIVDSVNKTELNEIRVRYLGRKGELNRLFKKIKDFNKDDKKEIGNLLNDAKNTLEDAIEEKKSLLTKKQVELSDWFDLTIPGKKVQIGHLHPQTQVLNEILDIFNLLGYQVADGPEVESDYYNFEVLNFPKNHPARDAQQTMFFDTTGTRFKPGQLVPRTHTSAMQGRIMKKVKPPFRVVVPGRCFRYEQIDASHGIEFWQVEGFAVAQKISLTDLFGTIEFVLKRLFGEKAKIRFATTYFPFVEPGVDSYLECTMCKGKGCTFCKNTGWSEIMPAGMIHPNVFIKTGINPTKWRGFAFALGLSRAVTLRYKIEDLRVLHTPDLRILKQF